MNHTTSISVSSGRVLRYGAAAGIAAVAANAAIYAAARAGSVDFVAHQSVSGADRIKLMTVVTLTLMTFAAGVIAALVANRVRRPSLNSLRVLAALIALGSTVMDAGIDSTVTAKLLLASMHIVTGIAYVVALGSALRAASSRTAEAVPVRTAVPATA
jgi:hypothetical protein